MGISAAAAGFVPFVRHFAPAGIRGPFRPHDSPARFHGALFWPVVFPSLQLPKDGIIPQDSVELLPCERKILFAQEVLAECWASVKNSSSPPKTHRFFAKMFEKRLKRMYDTRM